MRLRNIPQAGKYLKESSWVIQDPSLHKKSWKKVSGGRDIHIEIGMGKGGFLIEMARQNPNIFFIGLEKYDSVLMKGAQKLEGMHLDNILLIHGDAKNLESLFERGEIDKIYLTFSDPWPKAKHFKRRLTYRSFLDKYEYLLKEQGILQFRTDNQGLFDFSVQELQERKWQIIASTRDLHHQKDWREDAPQTEYERKFSSRGEAIYQLQGRKVRLDI